MSLRLKQMAVHLCAAVTLIQSSNAAIETLPPQLERELQIRSVTNTTLISNFSESIQRSIPIPEKIKTTLGTGGKVSIGSGVSVALLFTLLAARPSPGGYQPGMEGFEETSAVFAASTGLMLGGLLAYFGSQDISVNPGSIIDNNQIANQSKEIAQFFGDILMLSPEDKSRLAYEINSNILEQLESKRGNRDQAVEIDIFSIIKSSTRANPYSLKSLQQIFDLSTQKPDLAKVDLDAVTMIDLFRGSASALKNASALASFSKYPAPVQSSIKEAIAKNSRLELKLRSLGF